ncbi:MAG: M20/M25/M40 family metallo-hydrolase, partial [Candidatus Aminicenantes bacterium]|nr:M20/M25/M40 family metallo-hydrolase [Candidatus Aminicenantes bacterium]
MTATKLRLFLMSAICSMALALMASAAPEAGDQAKAAADKVKAYRLAHERDIVREYIEMLSLPNVASDSPNIRRNADFLADMFRRRGFAVRLIEADDAPPVVLAERFVAGARTTVALYAHYDGQPVNRADWTRDPWQPGLLDASLENGGRPVSLESLPATGDGEWRLYARSASDDKAPLIAMAAALDALRSSGIPTTANLKILLEGEEEAGSPHLARLLKSEPDLVQADLWLLCDGPVHPTRRHQVYFGARGVTGLELTVYGPTRPLHSGHYGNWAPNPALVLAHLLAGMRDLEGTITIKDYGNNVRDLTLEERRALDELPQTDEALRHELGLARTEGRGKTLAELIMRPSLNIRGTRSGEVEDKAQNAIPTEARASIDLRLVPDQRPEEVQALVEAHLRSRGFWIVRETPDLGTRLEYPSIVKVRWEEGYPAARTEMTLPVCQALVRVLEEAVEAPVI